MTMGKIDLFKVVYDSLSTRSMVILLYSLSFEGVISFFGVTLLLSLRKFRCVKECVN